MCGLDSSHFDDISCIYLMLYSSERFVPPHFIDFGHSTVQRKRVRFISFYELSQTGEKLCTTKEKCDLSLNHCVLWDSHRYRYGVLPHILSSVFMSYICSQSLRESRRFSGILFCFEKLTGAFIKLNLMDSRIASIWWVFSLCVGMKTIVKPIC